MQGQLRSDIELLNEPAMLTQDAKARLVLQVSQGSPPNQLQCRSPGAHHTVDCMSQVPNVVAHCKPH
jgi:hypothetical protein